MAAGAVSVGSTVSGEVSTTGGSATKGVVSVVASSVVKGVWVSVGTISNGSSVVTVSSRAASGIRNCAACVGSSVDAFTTGELLNKVTISKRGASKRNLCFIFSPPLDAKPE